MYELEYRQYNLPGCSANFLIKPAAPSLCKVCPLPSAITIALIGACALLSCTPAKPKVICVMLNPGTGTRVEMYKEIPYKVPAGYDEKKHIEQWKAEQIAKGYSVEVAK